MAEGYKDWSAGDILTAADLEDYTVKQSVMRFDNSSARTTALSGVLAEGMVSYLKDTDSVEVYDGSAWSAIAPGGTIQTYTPTWTAAGGTPTIGNGTLTGKYTVIKNWCAGSVFMQLGSTSSFSGTSEWRWSLPVTPTNTGTYQALGAALAIDAGTSGHRGTVWYSLGQNAMAVYASDVAATVGPTTPFTWTPASGDYLTISFSYEVA